jgi:hypothetical protein
MHLLISAENPPTCPGLPRAGSNDVTRISTCQQEENGAC